MEDDTLLNYEFDWDAEKLEIQFLDKNTGALPTEYDKYFHIRKLYANFKGEVEEVIWRKRTYNDAMLEEARSMKESKIQCFVGTSSAKENLNLIPTDKLKKLPVFDEKIRQILFDGFEGIVTEKWMDIVWSQLTSRVKIYEDICNNR